VFIEPTSGLDSQAAFNITRLLKKLAANGQAILCTIHQPSAVLFEYFDELILLESGGRTVYHGNLGHDSKTLLKYFEDNGADKCPPNTNPAEYMLEAIGAGAYQYIPGLYEATLANILQVIPTTTGKTGATSGTSLTSASLAAKRLRR